MLPCLGDASKIVGAIEKAYTSVNSRKTYLNLLVAPTKYIPELKEAVGDQLEAIRSRMMEHIAASDAQTVRKSAEGTVEALESIKARIPSVRDKYGAGSIEYLAALLQTNVVGLRGELGTVQVVKGPRSKLDNYYSRETGVLYISDFKTKDKFPPYKIKLPEGLMEEIEVSLDAKKRRFLMGKTKLASSAYGLIVKKALGVNVMDIRHSMITKLLDERGPSAASVEGVAAMFKHSPAMTTRYYRGGRPADDED